jgi:transposase
MSTSKIAKILHTGFGIKDVILKSFDLLDGKVIFRCKLKKTLRRCSCCRSQNVEIKETKVRTLRMVALGTLKTFLDITVHKYKCRDCNSCAWVNLPFAVGKFPMTRAFVSYILSLVRLGTVQGVAIFLGLQWKSVKNIHKDFLATKYKKINYRNLVYLSVDEFAIRKGHKYMTVFTDIRTGRVIYAVEGRKVDIIEPFLKKLALKARKLKAIAMDLSPTYIAAVEKHLPDVDIVFDRFHVMKLLNDSLDELRRKERQKYIDEGLDIGKGDRFLILKNFDSLDERGKEKIKKLFEVNSNLAKAHTMKEQLREFWNKGSKAEGAKFLIIWVLETILLDIPPLTRAAKTILRHSEGLLSYFDHRISNGKAEGTNNKIKVFKRKAYGYRDMDYFKLLLLDLHEKTQEFVG